jgi:hypothetical protein
MENIYLFKAIKLLKPNAQFSFQESDYSTIKWDVLEGDAPTQSEINAAIEQVKANEIAEAEAKATARAALLEQLGITEEQAKLLLS